MKRTTEPALAAIQARAYEIYLAHGAQHGHDLDHWLQAEYELRRLPVRKLATLHGHGALLGLIQTGLTLASTMSHFNK
jgi:hypothetical protein